MPEEVVRWETATGGETEFERETFGAGMNSRD